MTAIILLILGIELAVRYDDRVRTIIVCAGSRPSSRHRIIYETQFAAFAAEQALG